MKNRVIHFLLCLPLVISISTAVASAQMVRIAAFRVESSSLLGDIRQYKAEHPDTTPEDLAKTANSMLENQGLNYNFIFDANICGQVAAANQKDPTKPAGLKATLTGPNETAAVTLPPVQFDKTECGKCFVRIPALSMTNADFVTKIQQQNINFFLPPSFVLNEASLIDGKDVGTTLRKWKIPFRAKPVSISSDSKVLYLELGEKELDDLVLLVFSEGTIQFGTKKELDPDKKRTPHKDAPADTGFSYVDFSSGETVETVKFPAPCGEPVEDRSGQTPNGSDASNLSVGSRFGSKRSN